MPPPLAGAAAAASLFFATPIIGGITIGTIATTVALSGAAFLINAALAPSVKSQADQGQKLTVQQAVPSQRLIYGRALVGGPLFFYECKPPFLYLGIVLCSHEIDSVEEIRIGDVKVVFDPLGNAINSKFNTGTLSLLQASIRLGTDAQAIDPILAADFPELPSTYRQRGHATVVLKLNYGADVTAHEKYWGTGSPKPYFLVKGMKCYDPRKPGQSISDNTTWKWTDNASLCQAHFLTYKKGCNRSTSSIDIDTLKTAANNDDEQMELKNGGFENRYTVNGVVDTQREPATAILELLTANLGKIIWRNGKYSFYSGVRRVPIWTLNDDSARGAMDCRYRRPRADLANVVRTVFTSPEREYQTANGPVLRKPAYITADGEEHEITVTLPFTSTHTRAQRLASATLERTRLGQLVTRRESIEAIRLSAADVVNLESAFLPAINMVAEINRLQLSEDSLECEIELEEYDGAAIYAWNPAVDEQDFTILPTELTGVS